MALTGSFSFIYLLYISMYIFVCRSECFCLGISCRSRYCGKMLTSVNENRNRNRKLNSPVSSKLNLMPMQPSTLSIYPNLTRHPIPVLWVDRGGWLLLGCVLSLGMLYKARVPLDRRVGKGSALSLGLGTLTEQMSILVRLPHMLV